MEKLSLATMTWEAGPSLPSEFYDGTALVYQHTIYLVYKDGRVVKLNTEDQWEDVARVGNLGRDIHGLVLPYTAIGC